MGEGKILIKSVIDTFSGKDKEPKGETEIYLLKSMWVMMLSEFESSLKTIIENYIDTIKKKSISEIHPCLLIRNFYGNQQNSELTPTKILSYYQKDPNEITYANFTRDKTPKYKFRNVERLFNNLGVFFTDTENDKIRFLDSVASTRDSIAHGDKGVAITRKELENNLDKLENLLLFFNEKLFSTS